VWVRGNWLAYKFRKQPASIDESRFSGERWARAATELEQALDEGDGLKTGHFKTFAAAHILAGELIVAADHIGLSFGEAGAIAFIGSAGNLSFLAADDPLDGIFAGLAAMGASEIVTALFGALVEKVAFFHEVYCAPKRA